MQTRYLLVLITGLCMVPLAFWAIILTDTLPSDVLDIVEIREYEGESLSSINDFRENSIHGPQNINEDEYRLTVTGLVQNPQANSYHQVINNFPAYQKVVTLHCVEGWSVTLLWEGVRIMDLLHPADIDADATTVIFYAEDGYSTALPIEYLEAQNILLAYKMNEVTLPPERGFPFQLVAESKWGYKWIKWVTTIELSDNADYEGFWESRGYPNDADLP